MYVNLDSIVAVLASPGSYTFRPTLPRSIRVVSVAGPLICLKAPAGTAFREIGISYSREVRESLTNKVPSDMMQFAPRPVQKWR